VKKLVALVSSVVVFALSTSAVFAYIDKGRDGIDKDCKNFKYQEDAQSYFIKDGGSKKRNVDNLDADHDGIACEALPHKPKKR
jgi:hypothetical protein